MPDKMVLHLIANAHLDPVWLWDWREGLNRGIVTMRTVPDLMDDRAGRWSAWRASPEQR